MVGLFAILYSLAALGWLGATMVGGNQVAKCGARLRAARRGLTAGLFALAVLALSFAPSVAASISGSQVSISKDVLNGSNTGTIGPQTLTLTTSGSYSQYTSRLAVEIDISGASFVTGQRVTMSSGGTSCQTTTVTAAKLVFDGCSVPGATSFQVSGVLYNNAGGLGVAGGSILLKAIFYDGSNPSFVYEELPEAAAVRSSASFFPNILNLFTAGPGTVTASSLGPVYPVGAVVTLTAIPAAGATFSNWYGADGCSTALTCTVTLTAGLNMGANFSGPEPPIHLTTTTTGNGTIQAFPNAYSYVAGTTVTLTAITGRAATFTGWSGACSGTANTCTLTLNADTTVSAAWSSSSYELKTYVVGTGSGTISQSLPGTTFAPGTKITLTATAAAGSAFQYWQDQCETAPGADDFAKADVYAIPTCTITMNSDHGITADFLAGGYTLIRKTTGTGAGSVTASIVGSLDLRARAAFLPGTVVAIGAIPKAGSKFTGWSGDCSGTDPYTSCTITMNSNKTVTATFAVGAFTVTAATRGPGTVTVSPAAPSYAAGAVVTATATPASGSTFTGWGDPSCGTTTTCRLTIDGDKFAFAVFGGGSAATVRQASVFSTASQTSQSFLRFYNAGTQPGTVSVTLADTLSGQTLGQWTSPSIPPGGAPQYGISTIESALAAGAARPAYYSATVTPQFDGTFQHVLWKSTDGTLTNLSTCDTGVTEGFDRMVNVHSSLLGNAGYPSSIVVHNATSEAASFTLTISDAAIGQAIGTYKTSTIPANGELILPISTIEVGAGITPKPSIPHYVVKLDLTTNAGYLMHWLNNTKVSVITDMSTVCAFPTGTAAEIAAVPSTPHFAGTGGTLIQAGVFSSASPATQSFLRFYNAGTTAGTVAVTLADSVTGQTLGQWTSPSIAPGASPQYGISTVESALPTGAAKPAYYAVTMTSKFPGGFQHVLWKSSDGTLTNLSTCYGWVTAAPDRMVNVHSSLLGNAGYPSSIVIHNTGATAASANLTVSDAATGQNLGTTTTPVVPANGELILPMTTIEANAGITAKSSTPHYVIAMGTTSFTGYLMHLLNNTQVGVITDMSTLCVFPGAAS